MKLKILSWNIWTDGFFDRVLDFLKASNADIIGLQEVQADDPRRDIIRFLRKLGYQHAFAPVRKEWTDRVMNDGPAVFSKHKIIKTENYNLSKKDNRAAVRADVQVNGQILHIFSTHLVHTHQKPSIIQEEQAGNLIKVLPEEKVILVGDFNATSGSEAIMLMSKVLVNTDHNRRPTWSVFPEGCATCKPQTVDTKLDYIFTSNDIKTANFKVENSKASDHLPISVEIDV